MRPYHADRAEVKVKSILILLYKWRHLASALGFLLFLHGTATNGGNEELAFI